MNEAATNRRDGRERSGAIQALAWGAWVGVSLGAGVIGSLLSDVAQSRFYQNLQRPDWAPPASVFGPVWTVLFIMMGTAAWLVWREKGFAGARTTLILFLLHLIVNAAWTGIFFGLEAPGAAFAEILVLWAFIAYLGIRFHRINPIAGLLMVPYLVWVTYASALTFAIWRMNPGL